MNYGALGPAEVLAAVPQQPPFRFIDDIVELTTERITAHYSFTPDADFYRGHFPGNPVTPGVILLETMAQSALVAFGIYLFSLERQRGVAELDKLVMLFTDAQVEFSHLVRPGERVTVQAEKVFFRRRKLRARGELRLDDGRIVCWGEVSGMGVLT